MSQSLLGSLISLSYCCSWLSLIVFRYRFAKRLQERRRIHFSKRKVMVTKQPLNGPHTLGTSSTSGSFMFYYCLLLVVVLVNVPLFCICLISLVAPKTQPSSPLPPYFHCILWPASRHCSQWPVGCFPILKSVPLWSLCLILILLIVACSFLFLRLFIFTITLLKTVDLN